MYIFSSKSELFSFFAYIYIFICIFYRLYSIFIHLQFIILIYVEYRFLLHNQYLKQL